MMSLRNNLSQEAIMTKCYRVLFESFDKNNPDEVLSRSTVLEGAIEKPTNCLNFSMGLKNQIELIKTVQDNVIVEKTKLVYDISNKCPKCDIKLTKLGTNISNFHDVLTDHTVEIKRLKCRKCKYETPSTVRGIIDTNLSGELKKIQSQLGSTHSYRECEEIFDQFSNESRKINNHDRVKHVTEAVGGAVDEINKDEKEIIAVEPASELILNVDGGHLKTTDKDKQSMEAMISVVYNPESIESNDNGTRNYITSKHCAASIKDDNQEHIISGTIIAALKQGLTEKTNVTALCDGATNCWNVVEAIRPLCAQMTCILDWFHLAMKIQNISLPPPLKDKLIRIKWHLWRGRVDNSLMRLDQLLELAKNEKDILKIEKFTNYIKNNMDKIANYRERQKNGLVFTSNMAESTVESLINQRCKGQQHMRWSREGLNPVLQLRAAIQSNDWKNKWQTAVLNAA